MADNKPKKCNDATAPTAENEPDKVRHYEFDDLIVTVGTHFDKESKDTLKDILKRRIMREVDSSTSPK